MEAHRHVFDSEVGTILRRTPEGKVITCGLTCACGYGTEIFKGMIADVLARERVKEFPMVIDGIIYERAEVGVDGNCGYALLGPNIQEGEAEFVDIKKHDDPGINAERHAWGHALHNLRKRLDLPNLSYFIGPARKDAGHE
jgi:hypothetical protein